MLYRFPFPVLSVLSGSSVVSTFEIPAFPFRVPKFVIIGAIRVKSSVFLSFMYFYHSFHVFYGWIFVVPSSVLILAGVIFDSRGPL